MNVEPSEVTSELVVTTVGDGVVTITGKGAVVVGDDVSVEVKAEVSGVEAEADVNVDVEEVDNEFELEWHEDPKRVINTVTGTLTVNVAGTLTVAVLPK